MKRPNVHHEWPYQAPPMMRPSTAAIRPSRFPQCFTICHSERCRAPSICSRVPTTPCMVASRKREHRKREYMHLFADKDVSKGLEIPLVTGGLDFRGEVARDHRAQHGAQL